MEFTSVTASHGTASLPTARRSRARIYGVLASSGASGFLLGAVVHPTWQASKAKTKRGSMSEVRTSGTSEVEMFSQNKVIPRGREGAD